MKSGLRMRCGAADLNQGELAGAAGVIRQTINAIECERYDPSFELAFEPAAYFDCRVEDFFDPGLDADLTA